MYKCTIILLDLIKLMFHYVLDINMIDTLFIERSDTKRFGREGSLFKKKGRFREGNEINSNTS